MNTNNMKTPRNQAIECCRMAASIAVVFIHILFPGTLGSGVHCLARVAVPFFFVISGYFALGLPPRKFLSRFTDIAKIYLGAIGLYLAWGAVRTGILESEPILPWLSGIFTLPHLMEGLVFHYDHIGGGHLWYLIAMMACYLVMYAYARWGKADHRPLYILGGCLLAVQIILNSVCIAVGHPVSNLLYRNGWVLGLPLFLLGMFLREHQQTLTEKFRLTNGKLVCLFLIGAVLSMAQWVIYGEIELPVGAIAEVFALVLLASRLPVLVPIGSRAERCIARFGSLSTFVYVTHLLWGDVYMLWIHPVLRPALGMGEVYLRPIFVVILTLTAGILWDAASTALKRK